ncbi:MAG: hypothetical protein KDJ36_06805 [Hyphomicrobiaceae bacterium]|nr:hypothetical protein [Hyphomicrobiaceae bacterium]
MDIGSSRLPGIVALGLIALLIASAIAKGWSAAILAIVATIGVAAIAGLILACLAAGFAQADPNRARRQVAKTHRQLD